MLRRFKVLKPDGTERVEIHDDSKVIPNKKVIHKKLPLDLELRCQALWKRMKPYDWCKSYAQFNKTFRLDQNPIKEITASEEFMDRVEGIFNSDPELNYSEKQALYDIMWKCFCCSMDLDEYLVLNEYMPNKINLLMNSLNNQN